MAITWRDVVDGCIYLNDRFITLRIAVCWPGREKIPVGGGQKPSVLLSQRIWRTMPDLFFSAVEMTHAGKWIF
ncbi:MAG: hypothetical protein ACQEUY_02115 [Pseudomonadota bacterium]